MKIANKLILIALLAAIAYAAALTGARSLDPYKDILEVSRAYSALFKVNSCSLAESMSAVFHVETGGRQNARGKKLYQGSFQQGVPFVKASLALMWKGKDLQRMNRLAGQGKINPSTVQHIFSAYKQGRRAGLYWGRFHHMYSTIIALAQHSRIEPYVQKVTTDKAKRAAIHQMFQFAPGYVKKALKTGNKNLMIPVKHNCKLGYQIPFWKGVERIAYGPSSCTKRLHDGLKKMSSYCNSPAGYEGPSGVGDITPPPGLQGPSWEDWNLDGERVYLPPENYNGQDELLDQYKDLLEEYNKAQQLQSDEEKNKFWDEYQKSFLKSLSSATSTNQYGQIDSRKYLNMGPTGISRFYQEKTGTHNPYTDLFGTSTENTNKSFFQSLKDWFFSSSASNTGTSNNSKENGLLKKQENNKNSGIFWGWGADDSSSQESNSNSGNSVIGYNEPTGNLNQSNKEKENQTSLKYVLVDSSPDSGKAQLKQDSLNNAGDDTRQDVVKEEAAYTPSDTIKKIIAYETNPEQKFEQTNTQDQKPHDYISTNKNLIDVEDIQAFMRENKLVNNQTYEYYKNQYKQVSLNQDEDNIQNKVSQNQTGFASWLKWLFGLLLKPFMVF